MENNWSIEAIQERAANNWSLEGDNQLLNLMKSISKNLEQRCVTSNNNLDRLMLDVDRTKIKLENATTKLLDLNNAKFVEHTVMDMDSSLSIPEKCSTAESDKTSVPLTNAVQQAVTNGLDMMDRCYEKVLLNLEDSDDDENDSSQKTIVCRPKNPYLNRPLPHLIGTKQWNDKWHVGLIESDEEVLSDDEPEEFSQSSSEEEDSISVSPQTSNPPTTSESDFAAPKSAVIPRDDLFHRLSDDVEEKSPLFTPDDDNKHREKVKVLPKIVPPTQNEPIKEPINQPKQLTEPSVPKSEQPKQTIFVQPKTEQKFLNLFDDEPPLFDEPIQKERKPVNLFLDSDEDEDLVTNTKRPPSIFNNNVVNRPTIPISALRMDNAADEKKSTNAFDGDVDNNNVPVVSRSEIKPTLKSNDFGGLFDDEPPDDFFDIIVRDRGGPVDNKKPEKPKLQTKTVNLFESDDDDGDDDFSKIIGTTKKIDSTAPPVSAKENFSEKRNSAAGDQTPAVKQIEKSEVTYSPYSSPFRSLQNTGPPKSYKSFLDDDTPSFDDDNKQHTVNVSNESPTLHSSTSLFDDSPPDSAIVRPVTSIRTSPAKIIYDDIAETLKENSAMPPPIVSNRNVFDEVPPPDDTIVQPVALPRTSQPNVIHDNIAASEVSSIKETKSDDSHTVDETDQSLSFRKSLSLFANPEVAKLPTVDKENKPKPNKLKTNFNINVAALLPGAKLPSQKQSATVNRIDEPEQEKIENVSIDNTVPSSTVSQIRSLNAEDADASGRLTCLSKSRAKIQVQRRPSTRIGRQSLYNKSLEAEDENVVLSTETTDSSNSKVEMPEQVNDVAPSENISKTDDDWLSRTSTNDPPPPPPVESNSSIVDDDEEDWLKTVDEKPSTPSKTNLYGDDDWLSTKKVNAEPNPSTQNLNHVMNYDWLTASSLPPEDINPPSRYSIDDDHEQDDWLSSYVSKEKSSVVADLPNDEDDWLISNETQKQPREVVSAVKQDEEDDWLLQSTSQSATQRNVEVDEEDNDDWFTKSLGPPKASTSGADKIPVLDAVTHSSSTQGFGAADSSDTFKSNITTKKTFNSKLFDSDEDSNEPSQSRSSVDFGGEKSNVLESKTETKKSLSSTLFDDDDEEDVVPPTKASAIKTSVPDISKQIPPKSDFSSQSSDIFQSRTETKTSLKSKLFDDDDDDDDLFTSASKKKSIAKPTTSNTTETVKTTKNVSTKATGKSLFSDDDNSDSDDLFGTTKSTKKPKGKVETGNKPPKVAKPIKTGLFDDEDYDDEDIFSSKTQKQRTVQADTKKKPSINKLVATIPASNDPLADLLK